MMLDNVLMVRLQQMTSWYGDKVRPLLQEESRRTSRANLRNRKNLVVVAALSTTEALVVGRIKIFLV
jgi:hypothetical protein